MKYILIIPARYKSSRFPGKPLAIINGKTMIERVYNRCLLSVPKKLIYVATDNKNIFDHCIKQDIQCLMTSENCLTGTDRLGEVADLIHADYYINIQGDEPLFNPNDINKLIKVINGKKPLYDVYCGYCKIKRSEEFYSSHMPKVVFNSKKELLYISRAGIPSNKDNDFKIGFRQVCGYAFSKKSLNKFSSYKNKTIIENLEDIELLRFLDLGIKIKMIKMSEDSIPVDRKEDILKVLKVITNA